MTGIEIDVAATRGTFRLEARFAAATPGVVALFGPSGAGKSTLVKAIAGLVPARGVIRIDGSTWLDSTAGIDEPAERRGVGFVFQDARLFPHLDVAGNLAYGERRAAGRAVLATRADVIELLGLGALLQRRVHQLSGGERQRVAIGRALLARSRLLLLDEPLASVDAARRDEVLPYLQRLRDVANVPMLYVSHQYDEVLRLATHLVLCEAGRVVASGSPATLSGSPELRRMVGPDGVGSVLDSTVTGVDPETGLATVPVGTGSVRLSHPGARRGDPVRVHILARDVIVATVEPRGLSVRNALPAVLRRLEDDGTDDVIAVLELGHVELLARITRAAARELGLAPGQPVWGLVKAASLRGHAYSHRPAAGDGPVDPSTQT